MNEMNKTHMGYHISVQRVLEDGGCGDVESQKPDKHPNSSQVHGGDKYKD